MTQTNPLTTRIGRIIDQPDPTRPNPRVNRTRVYNAAPNLLTDAGEAFEIVRNLLRPLSAGAGDLREASSRLEHVAGVALGGAGERGSPR